MYVMYKTHVVQNCFNNARVILLQLIGPGLYPTVCASLIDHFGMMTSGTCETKGKSDRITGYAMLTSCAFHQNYRHQLVTEDDNDVDLGICSLSVSSKRYKSNLRYA